MKRHEKRSINIVMSIASVLFCLTLFSFHFLAGLYGRYTSTFEGTGSAKVAKFDISGDFSETMALEPGEYNTKLILNNNSEVAVEYTIKLNNVTNNMPYELKVDGTSVDESGMTVTGELAAETEVELTVDLVLDQEDAFEYMGMVDLIEIQVRAEQID